MISSPPVILMATRDRVTIPPTVIDVNTSMKNRNGCLRENMFISLGKK
jgi:hypothetical protein